MGKTIGIVLGIILMVIGIVSAIFGLISFLKSSQDLEDIQGSFMNASLGMVFMFVGFVLFVAGIIILYLTNIGKIFSYMAKETAPGVEKTSHALGKGLASGVKAGLKNKN